MYLKCYACGINAAKHRGFCMQWCSEECHKLLENSRGEIPKLHNITWYQHLLANLSYPLEKLNRYLYTLGFRWHPAFKWDYLGLWAYKIRRVGGLDG